MTNQEFEVLLDDYDDAFENYCVIWRPEFNKLSDVAQERNRRGKRRSDLREKLISVFQTNNVSVDQQ